MHNYSFNLQGKTLILVDRRERKKKPKRNYPTILWISVALVSRLTSMGLRESRRDRRCLPVVAGRGLRQRPCGRTPYVLTTHGRSKGHRPRPPEPIYEDDVRPQGQTPIERFRANRAGRGPSTDHRQQSARPDDPRPPSARYSVASDSMKWTEKKQNKERSWKRRDRMINEDKMMWEIGREFCYKLTSVSRYEMRLH